MRRRGGKANCMLAPAQTSFIVGPLNREARNAAQNRELLKRIAAETGGGYYTAAQTDKLSTISLTTRAPGRSA